MRDVRYNNCTLSRLGFQATAMQGSLEFIRPFQFSKGLLIVTIFFQKFLLFPVNLVCFISLWLLVGVFLNATRRDINLLPFAS